MQARYTPSGDDPLARYPDMMDTNDLAEFLNVAYATATKHMQAMPWQNVGTGSKNMARRIHKQHVRDRFNLPDPRIRRPTFGQK